MIWNARGMNERMNGEFMNQYTKYVSRDMTVDRREAIIQQYPV
jgi:hypothetical protein